MTYISPIFWTNDWPVWGTPDAPGKVPAVARKPIQGKPICQPAASDDFRSPTLGLRWQWNHNPDDSRWSFTERPGFLRLKPTMATNFWTARNTLTQKGQGLWSRGEVKFDLSHLKPGDVCGFGTLGKVNGHMAANCANDGKIFLSMNVIVDSGKSETRVAAEPISGMNLFSAPIWILFITREFAPAVWTEKIGMRSAANSSWLLICGQEHSKAGNLPFSVSIPAPATGSLMWDRFVSLIKTSKGRTNNCLYSSGIAERLHLNRLNRHWLWRR